MSFSFEITETPPVCADISTKREQAVKERAIFRKKNIRFMIGMATITSLYLAFIFIFVFPMLENPEVGIIFYFFPHLTFVIFIVGNHLHIKNIEKPSKLLDMTITELSEVEASEIDSIIDKKEHSAEITSYMEQVAAQGRSLVRAEADAIQKHYDGN
ncbi:MAG: hypothetical protein OEM38_12800 [Gammaproteobacteria bacterium]|nr:hypothetical protein [Gammaproteobacteria bacterium]